MFPVCALHQGTCLPVAHCRTVEPGILQHCMCAVCGAVGSAFRKPGPADGVSWWDSDSLSAVLSVSEANSSNRLIT
jgi:hypothetical protein